MELPKYLELLDRNTAETIEIAGCETGHPLHRANVEGWNLLQVLEHIVLTDQFIYKLLQKPSYYFATVLELHGELKLRRELIERYQPMRSPDIFLPAEFPPALPILLENFLDTRSRLKKDLLSGKIAINKRYYLNPFLAEMTVMDWLLFIPIHTERHHQQLQKLYAGMNREAC